MERMQAADPAFIKDEGQSKEAATYDLGVLVGLRDGVAETAPLWPRQVGTDSMAQVKEVAAEDTVFLSRFGPTGTGYDDWVMKRRRT